MHSVRAVKTLKLKIMRVIYVVCASLLLLACQKENEKVVLDQVNGRRAADAELEIAESKPPRNHPMFEALMQDPSPSLQFCDSIYRTTVLADKGKSYFENLKQYGFLAVIESGLINSGTTEQKQYYINEQLRSTSNLPNIKNFYQLLTSLKGRSNTNELIKQGTAFYVKNLKIIESDDWADLEAQKAKKLELENEHKSFLEQLK